MPLAKCPRCNQLFDKAGKPVCKKCEADEESDYEKIRLYLQDFPNQTAEEVAEGTGVDRPVVLRMLETGSIQNVATLKEIRCGRCGAPAISVSKRLCEACLAKLNAQHAAELAKIKLPEKKEAKVYSHMADIVDRHKEK